MNCEICGSYCEKSHTVKIDETFFEVCEKCKNYGAPVESPPDLREHKSVKKLREEKFVGGNLPLEEISLIAEFGQAIKSSRAKKGFTIKELGQKVFEKESVMHRIELGKIEPSPRVLKKLEEVLGIKLRE